MACLTPSLRVEQLAGEWERFIGPRVKELQVLLDETQDLTLFRERLVQLLDAEPSAEFIEALTCQSASKIDQRSASKIDQG